MAVHYKPKNTMGLKDWIIYEIKMFTQNSANTTVNYLVNITVYALQGAISDKATVFSYNSTNLVTSPNNNLNCNRQVRVRTET